MQELEGRPRVDVLCNMSGIFRDSFQNVVELLDDLFKRAAQAPEPSDRNFIRSNTCFCVCTTLRHSLQLFSIREQALLGKSSAPVATSLLALHDQTWQTTELYIHDTLVS